MDKMSPSPFICLLLAMIVEYCWQSARSISISLSKLYVGPCQARQAQADVLAELRSVSMQDEFARHAKLKRRLLKLEEESSTYGKLVIKRSLWLLVPIYIVLTILSVMFAVIVRSAIAFHLPATWVYPFGSLLAFPTGENVGSISMWWWLAASRQVLRATYNAISQHGFPYR